MDTENKTTTKSGLKNLGDKIEKAGRKIEKAGFPKIGEAVTNAGDKIEHMRDSGNDSTRRQSR